jgi:uncharacterized protein
MLRVDLRQLHEGPVETTGSLHPADPAFEGLDLVLDGPVEVDGRLQATGDGECYWHGFLKGRVRAECRRCLTEVAVPVDLEVRVVFSEDPALAEDPGVYELDARSGVVDVGVPVREELTLAVPRFLLCREDCAGLCASCGADLNAGPCSCRDTAVTV